MVIEAVYENLELKQKIFRELDALLKPSAILASNTSALDVDAIAAVTGRQEQVLGLHFFSPAHIMKLLEIVRGAKTSKAVLDASLELGKRMGKVSVISGNCPGFIGNRMLKTYVYEARSMLLEGAFPHQVDGALQGFGFAMGPFRMYDVVGIDLEWRSRQLAGAGNDEPTVQIDNRLCEAERFGQKLAKAITSTKPAAAKRSMMLKWMLWCSANQKNSALPVVKSAAKKSLSVACWRWLTKARKSLMKVSPNLPVM